MQPQPGVYRSHAAKPARNRLPVWVFGLLGVSALVALVVVVMAIAAGGDGPAAPPASPAVAGADQAYLDALAGIDPALAAGRSALADGRNICQEIRSGGVDAATLARNAGARYRVDAATGGRIVEAARASLCR